MNIALLEQVKAKYPIGLDIGSAGFRVVQLKRGTNGIEIGQIASWDRGLVNQEPEAESDIIERIAQFCRHVDFAGSQAVLALAPPAVELHPLDVPNSADRVDQDQITKAATWEIQRLSTLKNDEVLAGFWPLPASKRANATMMGVAASKGKVLALVDLCDAAGLDCVKVDVSSCALASFAWHLRGEPVNEVWGVLDVGHQNTRLAVCADASPVLVRTFGIGTKCWTEKIAQGLRLSLPAAEKHRREFGLSGHRGSEQREADPRERPAAESTTVTHRGAASNTRNPHEKMATLIHGILRDDLQKLALEAERSYEYVLQCYPKREPGDLVLVGGGALVNGLDAHLAGQLGIRVMPVSECSSTVTERLFQGTGSSNRLEICALACALSFQGLSTDA